MNENPLQGSFVIDQLTDLVEAAVLAEFDAINERGGVLGAMETGYQRGRIQDESMLYEHRKHDGTLPIVGVNTFVKPDSDALPRGRAGPGNRAGEGVAAAAAYASSRQQPRGGRGGDRPAQGGGRLDQNVFAVLMDAARVCSLGQITEAFFEVGGQYRRNV